MWRGLQSAAPALVPELGGPSNTRVEMSLVVQELKAHYPAGRSACATLFHTILNTVELRARLG